jgi:hypothetical protein
MESSSLSGKIQISESTYNLVSKYNDFKFISCINKYIKGKGNMNTYFIDLPDLSDLSNPHNINDSNSTIISSNTSLYESLD